MFLGRAIIKLLFSAGNLLVVLLLLLTVLASKVSPEILLIPAYSGLFLPLTIFLNVGFVLFWAIFRKWMLLMSLAVLIFCSHEVLSTFPVNFGKTTSVAEDNAITLLTYNTHANQLMKKHKPGDPNQVIQYILDKDPDVVCIQEFSANTNPEHLTHQDLMHIFKKYPYKRIHYKNKHSDWAYFGIATLSKYPILRSYTIPFESSYNSALYTDLNVHGKIVRLFNCHLESNRITEQDKTVALELAHRIKDNLDATNLKGATKLLSKKLGVAYQLRARQADMVASEIAKSPNKVIVVGDFNDVPVSYAYEKISKGLIDSHVENGLGLGLTYSESIFKFRIDYIFHDPTLDVVKFYREKVKYSDHYPLNCKINIH